MTPEARKASLDGARKILDEVRDHVANAHLDHDAGDYINPQFMHLVQAVAQLTTVVEALAQAVWGETGHPRPCAPDDMEVTADPAEASRGWHLVRCLNCGWKTTGTWTAIDAAADLHWRQDAPVKGELKVGDVILDLADLGKLVGVDKAAVLDACDDVWQWHSDEDGNSASSGWCCTDPEGGTWHTSDHVMQWAPLTIVWLPGVKG